jgi:hypothetical protein
MIVSGVEQPPFVRHKSMPVEVLRLGKNAIIDETKFLDFNLRSKEQGR